MPKAKRKLLFTAGEAVDSSREAKAHRQQQPSKANGDAALIQDMERIREAARLQSNREEEFFCEKRFYNNVVFSCIDVFRAEFEAGLKVKGAREALEKAELELRTAKDEAVRMRERMKAEEELQRDMDDASKALDRFREKLNKAERLRKAHEDARRPEKLGPFIKRLANLRGRLGQVVNVAKAERKAWGGST